MSFPDHFSACAADYQRFRPRYPEALFDWIADIAPARIRAWDCACGNGQATVPLAERFAQVIATDASEQQLELAPPIDNVTWRVARAESSGIDAHSVDVITVAQALHWFDLPLFWDEVRRVLGLGSAIVVWSYGIARIDDPDLSARLLHLHDGVVGPFWPINRGHVDARYQTIDFPFSQINVPDELQVLTMNWTLAELVGYVRTWSATRRFIAAKGYDPVDQFEAELAPLWGERRRVTWPMTIMAGRTT